MKWNHFLNLQAKEFPSSSFTCWCSDFRRPFGNVGLCSGYGWLSTVSPHRASSSSSRLLEQCVHCPWFVKKYIRLQATTDCTRESCFPPSPTTCFPSFFLQDHLSSNPDLLHLKILCVLNKRPRRFLHGRLRSVNLLTRTVRALTHPRLWSSSVDGPESPVECVKTTLASPPNPLNQGDQLVLCTYSKLHSQLVGCVLNSFCSA